MIFYTNLFFVSMVCSKSLFNNAPIGPVSTVIIKGYSGYLEEKAGAYRVLKYDIIRQQDVAVTKFRSIDDEAQLIRDSESVQNMIKASLACSVRNGIIFVFNPVDSGR